MMEGDLLRNAGRSRCGVAITLWQGDRADVGATRAGGGAIALV
jgi:hypothetical protein